MAKEERYPAVLVRLQPHIRKQLQAVADSQMRTITNLCRKILSDYAEQTETKPAKHVNGTAHKGAKSQVSV